MKITIDTQKQTAPLGDLFGIFFEDLNHAADGGLYAELVENRSFEFCPVDNEKYNALTGWERLGAAELTVLTDRPFCDKNPHYLRLTAQSTGDGLFNAGFNGGMAFAENAGYRFACYARAVGQADEEMTVSLRSGRGETYQAQTIRVHPGDWQKYTLSFTAPCTDRTGRLCLTLAGGGAVELDFISLFPKDTYKGRENGLRRDLAEKLEALHPKFMRFPGGCLIHDGALDPDARDSQYRWKNSIGPVEQRPARRNNWGYNQTLGLGYFEYFLLCEDIGAKPLPVLPGGFDPHHNRAAGGAALQAYVQDALDLIEFANGGADTVWGGKRAALGHPAPFGLTYLGIGNEEVGEPFFERYPLFHKAIKEKYPTVKIIGTSGPFAAGPEYDRGWRSAREEGADLVDEHYYQAPEWFLANHHRYDAFPAGPKVFLGEYASQDNTWYNALVEASYMVGLQNNARAVGLACYAPLFCNADLVNWRPDMIWFDQDRVMLTPNYYVQSLFMNHQGDALLSQTITGAAAPAVLEPHPDTLPGEVWIANNSSEVAFTDLQIVSGTDGSSAALPDERLDAGHPSKRLGKTDGAAYTIRLKAKETAGFKGFSVQFGRRGEGEYLYWKLGGWANGDCMIGQVSGGRDSVLTQGAFSVEKDRLYTLEIQVRGRHVACLLDGRLMVETEVLPVVAEQAYVTASVEAATGDVLVKLVNVLPGAQSIALCLDPENAADWSGSQFCLSGHQKNDRNTLGKPEKLGPAKESPVALTGGVLTLQLPPESVSVLRVRKEMTI